MMVKLGSSFRTVARPLLRTNAVCSSPRPGTDPRGTSSPRTRPPGSSRAGRDRRRHACGARTRASPRSRATGSVTETADHAAEPERRRARGRPSGCRSGYSRRAGSGDSSATVALAVPGTGACAGARMSACEVVDARESRRRRERRTDGDAPPADDEPDEQGRRRRSRSRPARGSARGACSVVMDPRVRGRPNLLKPSRAQPRRRRFAPLFECQRRAVASSPPAGAILTTLHDVTSRDRVLPPARVDEPAHLVPHARSLGPLARALGRALRASRRCRACRRRPGASASGRAGRAGPRSARRRASGRRSRRRGRRPARSRGRRRPRRRRRPTS